MILHTAWKHQRKNIDYTVRCHYNEVDFLKNIHKRHLIACPLGQVMGCLFVDPASDWYSASIPAFTYAISYHIWQYHNVTGLYLELTKGNLYLTLMGEKRVILMASCKTAVSRMHWQWRYCRLALSPRSVLRNWEKNGCNKRTALYQGWVKNSLLVNLHLWYFWLHKVPIKSNGS